MKRLFTNYEFTSYLIWAAVAAGFAIAWMLYPHPRQSAQQAGKVELTIWFPGAVQDSYLAMIEEFMRRNPRYRVIAASAAVRDATADPTRFLLGVAGGEAPDVIFFDRFAIVEWASRGAFQPLDGYLEEEKKISDGIRKENYVAPAWNEGVYKGKVYAIPNSCDTRALFYAEAPLIRAGFVYKAGDPEVESGQTRAGRARPPKTLEEICRKRLQAGGTVTANGTAQLTSLVRRPAVNEDAPPDAKPDLNACGARPGDVAALVAGGKVFRARIIEITGPTSFRLDFGRELPPSTRQVPAQFQGACEIKVFDQDGYIPRLSRYDESTGLLTSVGYLPMFGNSWLYMYGWLFGGEFMKSDGVECNLDSIEIVRALQWSTDAYDCLGGYEAANVFRVAAESGGVSTILDPFLTGKVAMKIDGDWILQSTLTFKPDMDFEVSNPPLPEARLKAGCKPVSWMGGWAFALPAAGKAQSDKVRLEGAWKLLQWLVSFEGLKMQAEYDASLARAKGQTFFPRLHPDTKVLAWYRERFLSPDSNIPPTIVTAFDKFASLLPYSRYRPVTPVGQRLWTEHVRSTEKALNHVAHPYESLNYGKLQVQIHLERALHPPAGPLVPWGVVIGFYIAAILAIAAGLVIVQERRRRLFGGRRQAWFEGFVCASPWLTGFLIFGAGPIVFSIIISFSHYDVLNPARFIGLKNYADLLGSHLDPVTQQKTWNDPLLWKSLGNTLFMVLGVPLGIAAGLALALLLDAKVRGLHVYRTIYYLPAIVPAVATFILWLSILSPSTGILNQVLRAIGFDHPPNWLQNPAWSKPALILMGLWSVGGGMIIWLAGLKDIPETLYEAAAIDGANRVQRFIHVTLPMLSPYILFNMVMGLIGVFQIFEAAFIMTDGGPADSTLFFAYKLFNEAFRFLNMGVASAMAWFLFILVLAITLFQLWLSKKWVHYGGG
ncbi:MAG: extracellular solute-binding protein [Candidatus Sumerlaeota bacterium]|nr:extracellular solute-binding protein [Candidatus Sumerlaeota bacterium]